MFVLASAVRWQAPLAMLPHSEADTGRVAWNAACDLVPAWQVACGWGARSKQALVQRCITWFSAWSGPCRVDLAYLVGSSKRTQEWGRVWCCCCMHHRLSHLHCAAGAARNGVRCLLSHVPTLIAVYECGVRCWYTAAATTG